MLMDCISIKVKEGDGLPYHICTSCKAKLTSLWNFRQVVLVSEMTLRGNCNETIIIKVEPYISNLQSCESSPSAVHDKYILLDSVNAPTNDTSSHILKKENGLEIHENNTDCVNEIVEQDSGNRFANIQELNEYNNFKIENNQNQQSNDIIKLQDKSNNKPVDEVEASKNNCEYLDHSNDSMMKNNETNSTLSKESPENEHQKDINTRRVQCKECNKVFSHKYYQQVHMHYHNGGRIIACNICHEIFDNDYQLKKHKTVHKAKCNICGEVFESLFKLRSHRTIHIAEPHTCHICNKQLRSLKRFKEHVLSHDKRFMCEVCGKCYSGTGALSTHKATHITEKTIPCSTCGKLFTSIMRLRAHLKWHKPDKPYKCDYCNKAFATSMAKKRHTTIHTGEKTYPCKICGKLFADSSTIIRHMLVHTGETPFACNKCSYKCRYKQQFDKHMKKHQ
ncbi:hypothetical protein Trydic_g13053 [Trypoxylus dichotomus]